MRPAGVGYEAVDHRCRTTERTSHATRTDEADREVDQAALDRVTGAVANTVAQGTATFTVTVETAGTGTGADGQQPVEADGEVDFEQEMRRIVVSGPEGDLEVVVDS